MSTQRFTQPITRRSSLSTYKEQEYGYEGILPFSEEWHVSWITADNINEWSMSEGEQFSLVNNDAGNGWAYVEKDGKVKNVPADYLKDVNTPQPNSHNQS